MLTEETRRRIRRIEIATGRLVDEVFAGKYESLFKGRGVEFAEVREYLPGDDVRSIDWNITARLGRPFVKKNDEEREMAVILCVDVSASQAFGSGERTKLETASEIAAIIAFSALSHNDKVGLLLFTDRVEKYIAPRKGRRHALRLIREILEPSPQGHGTRIDLAVRFLNHVQRRHAVVFLLSDFLGDAPLPETLLRATARRYDLSAFRLSDPREGALPPMRRVRLRDLERGDTLVVDTSSAEFQRRYRAAAEARRAAVRKAFAAAGADYAEFTTTDPVVSGLVRFFGLKEARRRRARRVA